MRAILVNIIIYSTLVLSPIQKYGWRRKLFRNCQCLDQKTGQSQYIIYVNESFTLLNEQI